MKTATIYYHKPKSKRTFNQAEALYNAEIGLERMIADSKHGLSPIRTPESQRSIKHDIPYTLECVVPEDSIFNCAANTLRSLGLTGKYDGFIYICRAIELILKEKEAPHFQSIYYDIGKSENVNRCSVERSIRYSINYIRKTGNFSKLSAIFGDAASDEKNFSNSKFLISLAADIYEKLTTFEV